jgi:hypothetical protein
MTNILLNRINTYLGLSISEYLRNFEKEFQKNINLEDLTRHFTSDNYHRTEKPHLYRRIIKSTDRKFESFEIVHDESGKIHAIVFNLNIKLSELQALFGQTFLQNEPYSNSTAFTFNSTNPDIEIIKTRHPEWLTKVKDNEYDMPWTKLLIDLLTQNWVLFSLT